MKLAFMLILMVLFIMSFARAEECTPIHVKPYIGFFYNFNDGKMYVEARDNNVVIESINEIDNVITLPGRANPEITIKEPGRCTDFIIERFNLRKRRLFLKDKETGEVFIYPIITNREVEAKLHSAFKVDNENIEINIKDKNSIIVDKGDIYEARLFLGEPNIFPPLLYAFDVPKSCDFITRNIFIPGGGYLPARDTYNLCKKDYVDYGLAKAERYETEMALCQVNKTIKGFIREPRACTADKSNKISFIYSLAGYVKNGDESMLRGVECTDKGNRILPPEVKDSVVSFGSDNFKTLPFIDENILKRSCRSLKPEFSQKIRVTSKDGACTSGKKCNIEITAIDKRNWDIAEHAVIAAQYEPRLIQTGEFNIQKSGSQNKRYILDRPDKKRYNVSFEITPVEQKSVNKVPILFSGVAKDCKEPFDTCVNPSQSSIYVYAEKPEQGTCCDLNEEPCMKAMNKEKINGFTFEAKTDNYCTGPIPASVLNSESSKIVFSGRTITLRKSSLKIDGEENGFSIKGKVYAEEPASIKLPEETDRFSIEGAVSYIFIVKDSKKVLLFTLKNGRILPNNADVGTAKTEEGFNYIAGNSIFANAYARFKAGESHNYLPINLKKDGFSIDLYPYEENTQLIPKG